LILLNHSRRGLSRTPEVEELADFLQKQDETHLGDRVHLRRITGPVRFNTAQGIRKVKISLSSKDEAIALLQGNIPSSEKHHSPKRETQGRSAIGTKPYRADPDFTIGAAKPSNLSSARHSGKKEASNGHDAPSRPRKPWNGIDRDIDWFPPTVESIHSPGSRYVRQ
jgi:hypothetical protein